LLASDDMSFANSDPFGYSYAADVNTQTDIPLMAPVVILSFIFVTHLH
jgi:hypothetical protein